MSFHAIGAVTGYAAAALLGFAGRALGKKALSSSPVKDIVGDLAAIGIASAISHCTSNGSAFCEGVALGASAMRSTFAYIAGVNTGLSKVAEDPTGKEIITHRHFKPLTAKWAFLGWGPVALLGHRALSDTISVSLFTYAAGMTTVYTAADSIKSHAQRTRVKLQGGLAD